MAGHELGPSPVRLGVTPEAAALRSPGVCGSGRVVPVDGLTPEVGDAALPPRTKKRWSDLTSAQKGAIVVGGVAELVITVAAVRDLSRRQAAQIRGPKAFWLLTFFVQPVGPLSYFALARRQTRA